MANNTKSAEISLILEERYHKKVKLTELRSGVDKDIYVASFSDKSQFVVLVNKRKTIMRRYRTILSNDFQQCLYEKGINVPKVEDLFEQKNGIIIACHTFIKGKQIKKLDKKTAWQCGKIIADMHNAVMSGKIYHRGYSFKYKLCWLVKSVTDCLRWLKDKLSDRQSLYFPAGKCHRDLNLTNFIFADSDVYLIDFDRHRNWPFVYELRRFIEGGNNLKYAADILKGYVSVRRLAQTERIYLLKKFPQLSDDEI